MTPSQSTKKGGTLRHTLGLMDPQAVKITSFKAPTEEEKNPHGRIPRYAKTG